MESDKPAGLCRGKSGQQRHACAAMGPCAAPATVWVAWGPCSARVPVKSFLADLMHTRAMRLHSSPCIQLQIAFILLSTGCMIHAGVLKGASLTESQDSEQAGSATPGLQEALALRQAPAVECSVPAVQHEAF